MGPMIARLSSGLQAEPEGSLPEGPEICRLNARQLEETVRRIQFRHLQQTLFGIAGTDVALDESERSRGQILLEAAKAFLTQANQQPLALLLLE